MSVGTFLSFDRTKKRKANSQQAPPLPPPLKFLKFLLTFADINLHSWVERERHCESYVLYTNTTQ